MITEILITVIVAIILALVYLVWALNTKVKNQKDENDKLEVVIVKQKQKQAVSMALIKSIANNALETDAKLSTSSFPFLVYDEELNNLLDISAIRFKKQDGKVNVYINGAMKPSNVNIILDDTTSHSNKDIELYTNIMKGLQKEDSILYPPHLVLEDLITLSNK